MLKLKESSLPNSLEEFQQNEKRLKKKNKERIATYNFSDDSDDDENLFCPGKRESSLMKTERSKRSLENDTSVLASTSLVSSLQLSSMNTTNDFGVPISESTRLCDKDSSDCLQACATDYDGAEQNVKSEKENTATTKKSTRKSRVKQSKCTMENECEDDEMTPIPCRSWVRKQRKGKTSDSTSEFNFPLDTSKKDGRSSGKKFQLYEGGANFTPVCADKSKSKLCAKNINFFYHGKLPATAEKMKKSTEKCIDRHNVKTSTATMRDSEEGENLLVEVQDNSMQTSCIQELETTQISDSEKRSLGSGGCDDERGSEESRQKEQYRVQDADSQTSVHSNSSIKTTRDNKVGTKLSPSLDSESNYLVLRLTPDEDSSLMSASSVRENGQSKKVPSSPDIIDNSSGSELYEVQDASMQTSTLASPDISNSLVDAHTSVDVNSTNVTSSSFYEVQDISVQTSQLSQLNCSNSLTVRTSQNSSPGCIVSSLETDQVNNVSKQLKTLTNQSHLNCEAENDDEISDDEALQQELSKGSVNSRESSPEEVSLYKTASEEKSGSNSLSVTGIGQCITTSQTSFYYTTFEQPCVENSRSQNLSSYPRPITPCSKELITRNLCDDAVDNREESLILASDSDDGMSGNECGRNNGGCNQLNAKGVSSVTDAVGEVVGFVEECIAESDMSNMSDQGENSYTSEAMTKLCAGENNDPVEKERELNDGQWTYKTDVKNANQTNMHSLGDGSQNSTKSSNVTSEEIKTLEVSSLDGGVRNFLDDNTNVETESVEGTHEMSDSVGYEEDCEGKRKSCEDMNDADAIVASMESLCLSKLAVPKQKISCDSSDDDDDNFENFLNKVKSQTQKTHQEEDLPPMKDFIVNEDESDESCGSSLSEDEDDELFYLKVNNLDSGRALQVRAEKKEYHYYSDDSVKENVSDDNLDDFTSHKSLKAASRTDQYKLELSSDDDLLLNIESDKKKTPTKKKTAVSRSISKINSESDSEVCEDETFRERKGNTSEAFKTPKRTNLWERPFETPAVVRRREDAFKTPSVSKVKKLPAQTAPRPSRLSNFGLDDTSYFLKSLSEAYPDHKRHPCALRHIKKFKETRGELTQKLFKMFNAKIFESKLPEDLNIEWNARYTKTAGTFSYRGTAENCVFKITLSNKVCDSPERVRDTLAHELCHAAVRIINGIQESHGRIWKSWARKVNYAFPFMPVIARCHDYIISAKYTYQCVSCKYRITRHTKSLDTDKKICGYCKGRFEVFLTRDLRMSGSDDQQPTPHTPRTPNRFAVFVKENYSEIKKRDSGAKHADVMKILSKEFAEKNKIQS